MADEHDNDNSPAKGGHPALKGDVLPANSRASALDRAMLRRDGGFSPPQWLWQQLRADPLHAPEHLALAAAAMHGPAAAAWRDQQQSRYLVSPEKLAMMAKQKHVSQARFEGAATGVGGVFTIVPDLICLAWIQTRMVFYIAAAFGFDPHDKMRPAELLVLQGIYPDAVSARRALDQEGTSVTEAYMNSKLAQEETLVTTLVKLVGYRYGKKFAAKLIPGFAIIFNSIANERSTRKLAERSIAYYSQRARERGYARA